MDELNNHEVIINMKLLKRSLFYNLIDPNGKQIFGYNIFRLIFMMIFIIVHTLVIYSNLGLFVKVDYKLKNIEFFLVMFADIINFLTFYKTCIMFYRVDKIMNIFDVTRIDFLTSKQCRKNNEILYSYRKTINKFTNFYCIFCMVVIIQWIVFAFLGYVFTSNENVNNRIPSVINMPFPVNICAYNQYYGIFFIIESIFALFLLYCVLMIDTYLLSYGWIIIAQYEVVALAFMEFKPKEQDKQKIGNLLIFLKKKYFNSILQIIIKI